MNSYVPPSYQSGNFDFFGSQQVSSDSSVIASRATRDFRNDLRVTDVAGLDGKRVPGVKQWWILVQNLSGGLNRVRGIARTPSMYWPYSDLDRMASGSADVTELGVCTLPLLTTYQARINGATPGLICGTNIFNRGVVSMGGAANFALWKETSLTDPTLTVITYTPGSAINFLSKHIIGGATRPENLFISRASAAVHVLSDITTAGPTVYGTMHANTSPSFGILTSPITAATPGVQTLLIYANNSISTLDSTQAVGTAPTVTLSSVPNGGYAVGVGKVGSAPIRAYWVIPNQDIAAGATMLGTPGSEVMGRVVSTNLEGTDPQDVKIVGLPGVYWAVLFNESLIVSDGIRIIQITDTQRDLKWVEQRQALISASVGAVNSDLQFRVGGLGVYEGALYVLEVQKNLTTSTASFTGLQRYQNDTGSWLPVNTYQNPASSLGSSQGGNLLGVGFNYNSPGSLPVSESTGNIFFCLVANGGAGGAGLVDLFSKYLPPFGYSTYWLNRQTSGAGATTGVKFETSAFFASPELLIEGLEGWRLLPEGVRSLADIAAGGTNSTVKYEFGTQTAQNTWSFSNDVTATFNNTDRTELLWRRWPDNTDAVARLKYQITLTQGSNLYMAPNALPFVMWGLAFDPDIYTPDMPVPSPFQVRGR